MSLKPNELSANLRMLGSRLLSFVADLPEQQIDSLLNNGGDIDPQREGVLRALDQVIDQVKLQRVGNQSLEHIDVLNIQQTRLHGKHLLNALRSTVAPFSPAPKFGDAVLDALVNLALDQFPNFLLTSQLQDGRLGLLFSSFSSPAAAELTSAIRDDDDFKTLFPGGAGDPLGPHSMVYTSLGRGSSIQQALLGDHLLRAAYSLMRSRNENSLPHFYKACEIVLKTMRSTLRNQTTVVPAILIFDGLSLADSSELALPFGQLSNVSEGLLELSSGAARPSTFNGNQMGVALHATINYKISASPFNGANMGSITNWPFDLKEVIGLTRLSEQTSLATALALTRSSPAVAFHRSTLILDPLFGVYASWQPTQSANVTPTVASKLEGSQIQEWAQVIATAKDEKIRIAVRRFLSALYQRQNAADAFIDAIVALENLFGERSEISLSVAASAAKLVESDESKRKQLFRRLKKLYAERSALLHGSKMDDQEYLVRRNEALDILTSSLRRLYRERPELLQMSSVDRSQNIILEN